MQSRIGSQQYIEARTQSAKDPDNSASALHGELSSPETPATRTNESFHDQPESASHVRPADVLPFSSVEQRKYAVEWDPRRYVALR